MIVDDYLMAACREAMGDSLAVRRIGQSLRGIHRVGVYFHKE